MIRKFLASFISFVFLVLFVPIGILLGVVDTFTDREYYSSDEFVETIHSLVVEDVPRLIQFEEFPEIDTEKFSAVLGSIVSKDDIRTVVDQVFEEVSNTEVGEDGMITLNIKLDWLLDKQDQLVDAFAEFVPIEVPADAREADIIAGIKQEISGVLKEELRTEFTLDLQVPDDFEGSFSAFLSGILQMFFVAGGLTLVLLLVLMWLVVLKPAVRVLHWQSRTVFIAAFMLSISMLMMKYMPGLAQKFFVSSDDELGMELAVKVSDLIFGTLADRVLIYSVPLAIISLLLLVATIFYERKQEVI